ncbi:uncharacterized protein LOC141646403 [Silene latifolia]|uniref:uncharacterized protein LOC141646403 n=1 Tax=Silene latifolia TaxID=37657 RepID=UPI003D76A6BB
MDRKLSVERSKRQDSVDMIFEEEMENWQNEVYKEIFKTFGKRKEEENLLTLRKDTKFARMHDLDRLQKTNKELVAKLEQVEIDKKFAVESRIELMKILDEDRKMVSCLEEKCVNLGKGIESSLKRAYMEREITYKSKILEEKEKLEVEREKNRALEEEVNKYKRLIEENDLIARRKEGLSAENKEGKKFVKGDEKLEKVKKVMREHMMRKEGMDRVVRLEKTGKTEADCGKNKLETQILVDANRYDCQDTLFGSEDDTVYVDFDSFELVENF